MLNVEIPTYLYFKKTFNLNTLFYEENRHVYWRNYNNITWIDNNANPQHSCKMKQIKRKEIVLKKLVGIYSESKQTMVEQLRVANVVKTHL